MIRTLIVEDEFGSRESLKAILSTYIKDVVVVAEATDIQSGILAIQEHQPDIIFLDIRLPDGDSFSILDQFPNATFEIIFVTAYSDYLQKAFDYFSLQYLTKPVDIEKLEKTIERYRQAKEAAFSIEKLNRLKRVLEDRPKILTIPHNDGIRILSITDIVRLEADGSYTKLILEDGDNLISTKGIGHYQKMLEKHRFFRTHKSHLINVDMILNISYSEGILLKNKDKVPLSQRIKKDFLDFIGQLEQ